MDTLAIRQKLHDMIDAADDVKLEHIYTIVNEENTPRYEWWKDEEFVAELEQISADMDSGKDKGKSWEEVKEDLAKRFRKSEV